MPRRRHRRSSAASPPSECFSSSVFRTLNTVGNPIAGGSGAHLRFPVGTGLLLTQVRRDPNQLRIALNAARNNLRIAVRFEAVIKNAAVGDWRTDLVAKVKFWSKLDALEKLAEHLGLLEGQGEQSADVPAFTLPPGCRGVDVH